MTDRGFLIKLTNEIYRLTLFFPKKEPLRYKMREAADNILANPNEKDWEILDNFFEVALIQNWVSPSDILAIQREYANLRGELSQKNSLADKPIMFENEPQIAMPESSMALSNQMVSEKNDRQEKILSFLKENGQGQVWQIKQLFPEVSKRTLRRDFEKMTNTGVLERIGERNETFYKIKTVQS